MARQYVGARYVPITYENPDDGSARWKANVEYEPLTIVVASNGDSYTSKKAVPMSVGAPQDNPEYWVKTGDFNASLLALQGRVNTIENVTIPALQGEVDTIDDVTIPVLQDRVTNTENRLSALEYDYCVWIGDSYTGAASLPSADRHNRYSSRVSSMLKLTEKNYAVGGNGFVHGTHTYAAQLQDAIDDFTNNELDPTKVQYFIIGGTRNDGVIEYADSSAYVAAVRSVITGALAYFTNARVIIIPLLWDAVILPKTYLESLYYLHYAFTMYTLNRDGVQIIDNAFEFMTGYFNDILYQEGVNVHWNAIGHWRVARKVYNAILGTPYNNESYGTVPFTTVNSKISNLGFSISKVNHKVHIDIYFETGAEAVTGNKTLANGTLNNLNLMPELYYGGYNVRGFVHTFSGDSYPVLVQQVVTKTGDNTGTCFMQLDLVGTDTIPANTKVTGFIELDASVTAYDTAISN